MGKPSRKPVQPLDLAAVGPQLVAWALAEARANRRLDAGGLAMLLDRQAAVAANGLVYLDGREDRRDAEDRRALRRAWDAVPVEVQLRICANVVAFVRDGRKPERWTA